MRLKNGLLLILFCIVALGLSFGITQAHAFPLKILRSIPLRQFRSVCGVHIPGMARCLAHVVTDTNSKPLGTTSPLSSSYGPIQFHTAYNLPCTPGGTPQSICGTPASFGGQTIAVITAYKASNITSDLNTYSSYYGLPACTTSDGCLTIVNQNGSTTLPGVTNSSWALETSLDVETAHMVCQTCKILLVEANDSYYSDLGTAINTAARMGATEISNSYGGSEWSGETSYDASYYSHLGIAVIASSGDSGYGAEFPASSPDVVGVGGTTLQLNTDNTYATESVWSGTGSGCSSYEPANAWQKSLANWNLTNCGTKRAVADVAADADPNTGAAVFDSTAYNGTTGWFQIGGTSLASPLIAGMYALAGGVPANTNATSLPYANFSSANAHAITQGSNGSCSTVMCKAGIGYNGPTGLGSPNGVSGFSQSLSLITPTLTPTPTPTPSISLTPIPTISSGPTITPTPTQTATATFGYTSIGNFTDTFDNNYIDGSRFKMGTTNGTVKSISAYVASVQAAPNNQYQVAIYSDNNGIPGTLLAKSSAGTLISNSWNTIPVSISLSTNTYYWLMYNTNSTNSSLNELKFVGGIINNGMYSSSSVSFGTWPSTFTARRDGYEYSIYATYIPQ